MTWRLAKSLEVLRAQLNAAAPNRSTLSDGTLGDAAHAARVSDHNPNAAGVVTAFDGTQDPAHGADMGKIAEALRKSRDPRIKYVVYNYRMFSSYAPSWVWRSYSGDPHTSHMHISVETNYDNVKSWDIGEEREWFDMATKAELREVIREELDKALDKQRKLLAVGGSRQEYSPEKINLREILNK